MKKILSCFALGLGLLTVVSCSNTEKPEDNKPVDTEDNQGEQGGNEQGGNQGEELPKVDFVTVTPSYTSGNLVGDYNLCESVQDGAILHCWNWSYKTIKNNLKAIAASGYSAVQTSPVQQSKSSAKTGAWTSEWSKLYQPVSMSIAADSYLGTKQELAELCEAAEQYGIKVIVDVVLNHMGNDNSGTIGSYSDAIQTYSPDIWADLTTYFHQDAGTTIDYNNQYEITHRRLSNLPDLNTGNAEVQGWALDLLKECIDCGVDGFRFDAAKHIETDLDADNTKSDFWKTIINGATDYATTLDRAPLYYYGEVLDNPGGGRPFTNYTRYMSVTDTAYSELLLRASMSITNSFANTIKSYKVSSDGKKSVVWAESHDTYANTDGATKNIVQDRINRAYALCMSHSGAAALYFARPEANTAMGDVGTISWKSDEVSAINNFRNKHLKETETISVQNGIYLNERGNGAAVIIATSGNKEVSLQVGAMADGTYYDQVTGSVFKVQNGILTGKMGKKAITVLEKTAPVLSPKITVSLKGGYFFDSIDVEVSVQDAESFTVSVNGGAEQTLSTTATNQLHYTDTTTIKLTAQNGTKVVEETYSYTQIEKKAGYQAIAGLKDPNNNVYAAWVWQKTSTGGHTNDHWAAVIVENGVAYIPTENVNMVILVAFDSSYNVSAIVGTTSSAPWESKVGQSEDITVNEDAVITSMV